MKNRKPVDIIATLLGLFAFVAYISYFIKLLIWPEGTFPFAVCIAVMIFSIVPLAMHKKLSEIIPKGLFAALKYIYFFAGVFYAITFLSLTVYIYSINASAYQPEEVTDETVIIVYGAGLESDGKPGKALIKRLNKAMELSDGTNAYIIVTGGMGFDEPRTEASAMKEYLVEKGMDPDRIILEDKAADTKENVRYSFELIKEYGLEDHVVVSVSNKFHVPRIRLLCSLNGYKTEVSAAEDPAGGTVFASLVREYMSYVKVLITGHEC